MATGSSTRPPTFGEGSSATEGEGRDVPIADVADWGHAIPEAPPEPAARAASFPSLEIEVQEVEPEPHAAPVQASAPSVVLPADEPPVIVAPELELRATSPAPPLREAVDSPVVLPEVGDYGPSIMDDPAQITAHASAPSLPGTRTPPPETPLPVLLLVDQARSASGAERQELSRRINRWLDQMVRDGGSRHVADWFHHLIESGRLEDLADEAGHSCHETAVRGLLAMGFPYALEVRPEDLERIKPREQQRRSRRRGRDWKGGAAGVLVGGAITELVLNLLVTDQLGTGILLVEVGLALLAAVALLLSGPRTPLRHMGLAVLLVVSTLSISLALLGGYAGLVSGLAGLVAALLCALHRS